ncbi:zinc-binding dehydrogenase [Fervidibacillus halotolerans]|uniref:Zinc-binding dehydrogenase n=2 Tax=Fervidibacillus halotolerans TaxID=2980027 RepID=A0A9E8M1U6_9BACI|nr:zinc-binding dehydrogenase [Fervidibacillus halotolerans]WAA13857.1 zinc-binding dehydrogenase [Fervidibacillus halotolerans]
MKAAVWYGKQDVRIEDRDVKPVDDNDVKVRVAWTGICGTDLHEWQIGPILLPVDQPHKVKGETTPLVLGHEVSGVVEEVGKNVTGIKPGDRVVINPVVLPGKYDESVDRYYGFYSIGLHTDGSFTEYVVIDEKNIIPVPEDLPFDKAALAEPLSVSYQAVKHAGVKEGNVVAIFSCGPIELLAIIAAKAAGAKEIYAFDLVEERLEKAKEVGATEALNSGKVNPVEYLREKYPQGVDVSLEAAGVKPTFDQAIAVTRPLGNVCIIAVHTRNFEFNPLALMTSGVKLSSSMGYTPQTIKESLEILRNEEFNFEPIMTKKIELDDLVEEGFQSLANDPKQAKIVVKVSGDM